MKSKTLQAVSLGVLLMISTFAGCSTDRSAMSGSDEQALQARAMRVLTETPLIDGHNDVPWQYRNRVHLHLDQIDFASDTTTLTPPMHSDIDRLRAGGIGGQFWSVYIPAKEGGAQPGDARILIEQIDFTRRMIEKYSDTFELASTADDVVRIHKKGKIASMMGIEGGHSIEHSLGVLRIAYLAGARYMGLTHTRNIAWADSGTDDVVLGGLSEFGKEVVREMNRLGMIVDLAHTSPGTMRDALAVSTAPLIFSHANAVGMTDSPRNVPDDVLDTLKGNGGVVMITFVPSYASQAVKDWSEARGDAREALAEADPDDDDAVQAGIKAWQEEHPPVRASIGDIADHFDYIRDRIGIEHLGVGGDFDGIRSLPIGLEDVSKYPALFAELYRRGYSDSDLAKIAGENVLRVFRGVEKEAARLQKIGPASDVRFEEVDVAGADRFNIHYQLARLPSRDSDRYKEFKNFGEIGLEWQIAVGYLIKSNIIKVDMAISDLESMLGSPTGEGVLYSGKKMLTWDFETPMHAYPAFKVTVVDGKVETIRMGSK